LARRRQDLRDDQSGALPTLNSEEWELVIRSLGLTPREADVVRLILSAQRDKQIACTLRMSVSTVRTHLRHVFAAQRIGDRSELVLRIFAILRENDGSDRHHHK